MLLGVSLVMWGPSKCHITAGNNLAGRTFSRASTSRAVCPTQQINLIPVCKIKRFFRRKLDEAKKLPERLLYFYTDLLKRSKKNQLAWNQESLKVSVSPAHSDSTGFLQSSQQILHYENSFHGTVGTNNRLARFQPPTHFRQDPSALNIIRRSLHEIHPHSCEYFSSAG